MGIIMNNNQSYYIFQNIVCSANWRIKPRASNYKDRVKVEEVANEYSARKSGKVDPLERPKVEPPKVEVLLPISVLPLARMQAKVGWFIMLAGQSLKPSASKNISSNLLIKKYR